MWTPSRLNSVPDTGFVLVSDAHPIFHIPEEGLMVPHRRRADPGIE